LNPLQVPASLIDLALRLYQLCTAGAWRGPVMAMAGAVVGLALLALQVSNAKSYLSNAPEACINCHVMVPYFASWERSSHRRVASCNDCHIPHDNPLRTLFFKAQDGLRHATIFTLQRQGQVLQLNPGAVPVVRQNCVRCHEQQIMMTSMGVSTADRRCWECHRETPHGLTQSLSSTPHVRRPILPSAGMPYQQEPPGGVPGRESDKEPQP
jgi:cytochrome c nitrite reductase small subunit